MLHVLLARVRIDLVLALLDARKSADVLLLDWQQTRRELRVQLCLRPREHRLEDALGHVLLVEPDDKLLEDAVARAAVRKQKAALVVGVPASRRQEQRPPFLGGLGVRILRGLFARRLRLLLSRQQGLRRELLWQRPGLGLWHEVPVFQQPIVNSETTPSY